MHKIRKLEGLIVKTEQSCLVVMIIFMTAVSFLQVLLRVVFSTGILWADTLLRHLVLWVGFLGAGLAAASNRQFAMDIAPRALRGRTKILVEIICHLFAACVSGFLCQASVNFFREEYSHPETLFSVGSRNIPTWVFELILPIGFGLLAAHYVLRTVIFIQNHES